MKKSITRTFIICLVALLLCSFINWGIVSDWGKVSIRRIDLIGDNGMIYSALQYTPKAATNESPAPAVITLHGASGNARGQEGWAVEFARRGFVVVSIDNFGGGNSEHANSSPDPQWTIADKFYQYMLACPVIDNDNIVTMGHSLGCPGACALGYKYNAKAMIVCSGVGGRGGADKNAVDYNRNILVTGGTAEHKVTGEETKTKAQEWFNRLGYNIEGIELGKVYGSFENGDAKQAVVVEGMLHEFTMCNTELIGAAVDFAQKATSAPNPLDAADQVWLLKDFAGLAGMIAFVATMIALAVLIVEKVPFFNTIKQPLPRNIGLRGKGLALSVAAAIIFPTIVLYTGAMGIDGLFQTKWGGYTLNRNFSTVIGINLLGVIMLVLFCVVDARKHKATIRDLGLTSEGHKGIDVALIGKSLLLAIVVLGLSFGYLAIQEEVLGTDFFCFFFGVKTVPLYKLPRTLGYVAVWVLCFIIQALGLNVERRLPSTGNEAKDTAIAVIFNILCCSLAVTFIVVLQIILQIGCDGTKAMASWGIDLGRLWGMPFGMIVAGAGQTILYRKTGSIWPGVLVCGLFCGLTAVAYGHFVFA